MTLGLIANSGPAGRPFQLVCSPFIACYKKLIEQYSANAFIIIGIAAAEVNIVDRLPQENQVENPGSSMITYGEDGVGTHYDVTFSEAANYYEYVLNRAGSHQGSIRDLSGCCHVFTLVGVTGISSTCAAASLFLTTNISLFNDPQSKFAVQNPQVLALVVLVITAYIAHSFMMVVDHVANALLFGFEHYRYQNHAIVNLWCPDKLMKICNWRKGGADAVELRRGPISPMFSRASNAREMGRDHEFQTLIS